MTAEPAKGLPPDVAFYKRTAEFTEQSIPAGLQKAHSTKEGSWGLIRVVAGELLYRVADERRQAFETILRPGSDGVVEPEILHQVEPLGPVRFHVEFFR